MIKYRFDRTIEIIVFFLFLINTILGTVLLTLYYLKKFELSETKFIIFNSIFHIYNFCVGRNIVKEVARR
jgi:hypothetical protein